MKNRTAYRIIRYLCTKRKFNTLNDTTMISKKCRRRSTPRSMPNSGRHISISRCRWTRRTKGSKVPHTGSYTSSRRSRGTPRSWRAISNRRTPRSCWLPIAAVQTEWPSVVAMFEDTLAHEQKVTAMIHDLCKLAAAEQDFRNGEHAAMVRQRAGRGGRYGPRYS